jgi:hypothetical protein
MQNDYDFVVQLGRDVVCDVQTRTINASLLRNLHMTSPFSRVVAQRLPPFQMKVHWGNPKLDYGDDLLKLSVDVQGGVRQPLKHVNLTMEASVHADCQPRVAADAEDDQPVVTLTALSAVALAELKLSYEGDEKTLSWFDKMIAKGILRRGRLARLMTSLADLPLSYLPDSWPLRVDAKRNGMAADGLVLAESAVSLNSQAESLTLAMRCAAETPVPGWTANLLPESAANMVVALGETGLNSLLGRLCAQGLATGTVQLGGGSVAWCWTHVTASFTGGQDIHLTGELLCDETTIKVDAAVTCSLTSDAQLSVQLSGHGTQLPEADLIIKASATVIRRIFFAATRSTQPANSAQTEPDPAEKMLQRFLIPGTGISVEAPAVDLAVRHGYLVASYAVPMDENHWQLVLKKKMQKPTIVQSWVPRQMAPDVPIVAQFDVTLTDSTEPPYDYAWRINGGDLESNHSSTVMKKSHPR